MFKKIHFFSFMPPSRYSLKYFLFLNILNWKLDIWEKIIAKGQFTGDKIYECLVCQIFHLQQSFLHQLSSVYCGSHQGCGVSGYWDLSLSLPTLLYSFFSLLILVLFSDPLFFWQFLLLNVLFSFHHLFSLPLSRSLWFPYVSLPHFHSSGNTLSQISSLDWAVCPLPLSLFLAKAYSLHPNL